jgi:hypothetical protein
MSGISFTYVAFVGAYIFSMIQRWGTQAHVVQINSKNLNLKRLDFFD